MELFYAATKEAAIAVLTEDDPVDAIPIAQKLNAFAINPNFKKFRMKTSKIHAAGLKIYPWTINEPADIEEMKRLGVDAIITDFRARLSRIKLLI